MRTIILIAGKLKQGPERTLFDHYAARLTPAPVLRELGEKKNLNSPARKKNEGEKLLHAVPDGAVVVALDEKGKTLTSPQFAGLIADWRDDGAGDLAFLVGGADGLDQAVTGAARLILSLGRLTWPHKLVPGLLAEQLFRAQCILTGHPYHRE